MRRVDRPAGGVAWNEKNYPSSLDFKHSSPASNCCWTTWRIMAIPFAKIGLDSVVLSDNGEMSANLKIDKALYKSTVSGYTAQQRSQ